MYSPFLKDRLLEKVWLQLILTKFCPTLLPLHDELQPECSTTPQNVSKSINYSRAPPKPYGTRAQALGARTLGNSWSGPTPPTQWLVGNLGASWTAMLIIQTIYWTWALPRRSVTYSTLLVFVGLSLLTKVCFFTYVRGRGLQNVKPIQAKVLARVKKGGREL